MLNTASARSTLACLHVNFCQWTGALAAWSRRQTARRPFSYTELDAHATLQPEVNHITFIGSSMILDLLATFTKTAYSIDQLLCARLCRHWLPSAVQLHPSAVVVRWRTASLIVSNEFVREWATSETVLRAFSRRHSSFIVAAVSFNSQSSQGITKDATNEQTSAKTTPIISGESKEKITMKQ
jgi:hypothetical protein